jgi:hypothetical protein
VSLVITVVVTMQNIAMQFELYRIYFRKSVLMFIIYVNIRSAGNKLYGDVINHGKLFFMVLSN